MIVSKEGCFVFVFSPEDFEKLSEMGYHFLRKSGRVYIFDNDGTGDLTGIETLYSNSLLL